MQKKKTESQFISSPIGEAMWAMVTEGKVDELSRKHTIQVMLSDEDAKKVEAGLEKCASKWGVSGGKLPIRSKDGKNALRANTKKLPSVVMADGTPFSGEIPNGSKVSIQGSVAPYRAFGGGITMYLNKVTIFELAKRQMGSGSGELDFLTSAPVKVDDIEQDDLEF